MQTFIYCVIIVSYIGLQGLKLPELTGNTVLFVIVSVSLSIFALSSYFTWKKTPFSRFITSGFLAFSGLLMLPLLIAPALHSVALRILLSLIGLFWLASSIWILKAYSVK